MMKPILPTLASLNEPSLNEPSFNSSFETEFAVDPTISNLYSKHSFDSESIDSSEEFSDNYETGFDEESVNSEHYKNHYSEISKPADASVIEDLHVNLMQLDDLHRRLQFVMGEVRSLIKRK